MGGRGVYKILVEIPEEWRVIFVFKYGKFRRRGGDLQEIPPVVGAWIFSGTTH